MGVTASHEVRGARIDDAPAGGAGPGEDEPRLDDTPRRDANRRFFWLTLGLALVPFAVSGVALVVSGQGSYVPTGDYAMTEARVSDVISDTPLIGLYSRADWAHPGPLMFYALAPCYWLTGGSSIGIGLGALAINAASVAGMALIARRHGGLPLMLCVVIGSGLLIRTLGAEFMHDQWNTLLPVLPFGLLIFLTWAMTCGDRWALPAGVLVTSFVAQAHIGFVPLALPLLLWGAAWLVLHRLRGDDGWSDVLAWRSWPRRLRPLGGPVILSGAIGVLAWLPPFIDAVSNTPSNASRAVDWFREAAQGTKTFADGVRVMVGQFELQPEWLTSKLPSALPIGESPFIGGPPPVPLLLVPVAIAAGFLWVSRRSERRHLVGLLALVLVVGIVAVSRTVGPAFDYRLRWTWVPPMLAFAIVTWAAWLAVVRWRPAVTQAIALAAVVVLAAVSGVNAVVAAGAGNPRPAEAEVVATVGPPVLEAVRDVDGDGVVLVAEPFHGAAVYARGLAWYLEREGVDVRVEPTLALHFGEHRVYDGEPVAALLQVLNDDGIDNLAGSDDHRLLAMWETEHIEARLEAREAREAIVEALVAGEIDEEEYARQASQIPTPPNTAKFASQVAVYLDDRRPVEPYITVGHGATAP